MSFIDSLLSLFRSSHKKHSQNERKARFYPSRLPNRSYVTYGGKKYKKGQFLGKGGTGTASLYSDDESMEMIVVKEANKKNKKRAESGVETELENLRSLSDGDYEGTPYIQTSPTEKPVIVSSFTGPIIHEFVLQSTDPGTFYYLQYAIALKLNKIHKTNHIHGDLKSDNVTILNNKISIIDFGSLKAVGAPLEKIRFQYDEKNELPSIPPEMIRQAGESYESVIAAPSHDIYMLGYMFRQLLKNTPLKLHKQGRTALTELTESMLKRDPAERPTLSNVLATLKEIHEQYPQKDLLKNQLSAFISKQLPRLHEEKAAEFSRLKREIDATPSASPNTRTRWIKQVAESSAKRRHPKRDASRNVILNILTFGLWSYNPHQQPKTWINWTKECFPVDSKPLHKQTLKSCRPSSAKMIGRFT